MSKGELKRSAKGTTEHETRERASSDRLYADMCQEIECLAKGREREIMPKRFVATRQ